MFRAAACVVSRAVWLAPARSEQWGPPGRPRSPFPRNSCHEIKTRASERSWREGKELGVLIPGEILEKKSRTAESTQTQRIQPFVIFSQTAATEENVKSSFRFESRILTRDVTVHSALSELTRRISRASWTEISLHLWKKTWEAVGDVRFAPGGRDAHDSCATPLTREPTEIPRVQVRSKTSARARRVFSRVRRAEVRFSALARVGFSRESGWTALSVEPAADPANRTPSARSTRPRPASRARRLTAPSSTIPPFPQPRSTFARPTPPPSSAPLRGTSAH